ncbi:MAG: hypothetical protein GYB68_17170 [Chloroflexi bacterium]|nr:hypothetical protein [Chloroflexota bacterium]
MPQLPNVAFKRRLDDVPANPATPKGVNLEEFINLLPLIMRLRRYTRQERKAGRIPAIDLTQGVNPGPIMGVPAGGIGGGSITRGWQGDFARWNMQAGMVRHNTTRANQFSVRVKRPDGKARVRVMNPGEPESGSLTGWNWGLRADRATYFGLFPRAWSTYHDPDPKMTLTCRQISPVIPHNYRESATPAVSFVWTLENTGEDEAEVSVMFTFQNGAGDLDNDRAGGHHNAAFRVAQEGGDLVGVELHHILRQPKPLEEGQSLDQRAHYEDQLSYALAVQESEGVSASYRSRFVTSSSGMDVWNDFRQRGTLPDKDDQRPAAEGMSIGAAVCATVTVPPGESREIVFGLAWDMPLARFASGDAWYRRYTRFYGREGKAAQDIVKDAILNYADWETQIEAWQVPILENPDLPDWYKAALFNELYYIVDGGTVWTDGREGEEPPAEEDFGHFAYLEGHEYRLYNTYDVHFYASFALAMLWPEIELSLQRDVAATIDWEDDDERLMLLSNQQAPRKRRGAIPHDLGAPTENPWELINAYVFRDTGVWKDLNCKFVLQVYRDFVVTGRRDFLEELWPVAQKAIDYLRPFDSDDDGLIENDGADQTYDTWTVYGPSAYTGGLWLASLSAMSKMAEELGDEEQATAYREQFERAAAAYDQALWNGDYYDYDASGKKTSTTIMADQIAGHWYAQACGIESGVPEENARSVYEHIQEFNVGLFEQGEMGAVNGMLPNGKVDVREMQPQEVWPGVTYGLAAGMLHAGMDDAAWETAKGVVDMTYGELGLWYQTPEAWIFTGEYRSLGYMRPLAIWAMQWALEQRQTKEG